MNNRLFILGLIGLLCAIAVPLAPAATIPAGTHIVVRTLASISSHAKAGGVFMAKLEHSIVSGGKVILPEGTRFYGVVEASRSNPHRTSPLILDLTSVVAHGKQVPIKTAGGFEPQVPSKSTRHARAGFTTGHWNFPDGIRIEVRLLNQSLYETRKLIAPGARNARDRHGNRFQRVQKKRS